MISEQRGNLLKSDTEAVVNTVNTVGVMGKGIALQFKRAFPENYKAYKRACDQGQVELGKMFVWDAGALFADRPRFVVNFPTKKHWKSKSRLSDIETGLADLVRMISELGIRSIALPPLGCGYGGLEWNDVKPLIAAAFDVVPDVEVRVYPPDGAPAASEQVNRTDKPSMTPGRAILLQLMAAYLPRAVEVTQIDIQKLMYFMQEAGEPLKLRYVKGRYGPYADNLRHVLAEMEGHFITGIGDQSSNALDIVPFELMPGALEKAIEKVGSMQPTQERLSAVSTLLNGFESTYDVELLSTVHWAATRDSSGNRLRSIAADESVDEVVRSWNIRKQELFTPRHVRVALEHLRSLDWLDSAGPPQLTFS